MNKAIYFLIIGIFIINGLNVHGFLIDNPSCELINIIFSLSEPKFKNTSDGYVKVELNEASSYLFKPGRPLLPIICKVFTFPIGTHVVNVEVYHQTNSYSLDQRIIPCPKANICSDSFEFDEINNITLNNTQYYSNNLYPEKTFIIQKGAGLQNDKRVLFLTVKIVPQYNSNENIIYIPKKVKISIEYITSKETLSIPNEYDMVIITPNQFSEELQPLIEHKNDNNVNTFLKTTEEIFNEFSGKDDIEKIKYFIHYAIENYNISYVLLVGSINKLPIRISKVTWRGDNRIYLEKVQTDLYYADIYDANGSFCSWDSNDNNEFGEFIWDEDDSEPFTYIDNVDLYSDIHIGRIPCKNKWELRVVIDKIISYETETFDKEWFKNIILMGGDTDPGGFYEGEIITHRISLEMQKYGFNPIKLWASNNELNPFLINSEITKGAGFVSYEGHGNPLSIMTYSPNGVQEIVYTIFHTFGLFNGMKLPVVFLDACSTSKLDFSINGLKIPCFAWTLLKKGCGGAITVMGATELAYNSYDNIGNFIAGLSVLHFGFFKAYYQGITVGEMLIESKNNYLNTVGRDCLTLEEFILLGDPSLKIGGYNNN